jgi:cytochrome c oxidase subunit 2
MTQTVALVVLLVVGLVWTGLWAWVMASARREGSYDSIYQRVGRIRRWGLYGIGAVAVVAFAASMWRLPYPAFRSLALGEPVSVVDVVGHQWFWDLSQDQLPAGVPIEFRVTASDVNHSFGLYNPDGVLVAQVQAMPGRTNSLIYTFSETGEYEILCMELCGVAHHAMRSAITVAVASPAVPEAAPPGVPAVAQEPPADDDVATETLIAEGGPLYQSNCAACHGAEGRDGFAPLLIESPIVASAEALVRQILDGSPANGMPPFARLNDREAAAIATYVRSSWGNSYAPVQPAMVADGRGTMVN